MKLIKLIILQGNIKQYQQQQQQQQSLFTLFSYKGEMRQKKETIEEMLTKNEVLFVQFMLWWKSRYSNFSTLSYTSSCEIPSLLYT